MDKFLKKVNALAYYGGKANRKVNKWIISILPYEKESTYIEPFAGMLGILLNREPTKIEIANDINERIINWWFVVREQPEEFGWLIENTPMSRSEFILSISQMDDMTLTPIRRALAFHTCILQSMHSGDNGLTPGRWRRKLNADSSLNKWKAERIHELSNRIHDIQLENCDAVSLLEKFINVSSTLIYLDPPYISADTSSYKYGAKCLNISDLSDILISSKGKVGISGYGDEWDHMLWNRHTLATRTSIGTNNSKREEVLWTNF